MWTLGFSTESASAETRPSVVGKLSSRLVLLRVSLDRSADFPAGSYGTQESASSKPRRNLTTTDAIAPSRHRLRLPQRERAESRHSVEGQPPHIVTLIRDPDGIGATQWPSTAAPSCGPIPPIDEIAEGIGADGGDDRCAIG